MLEVEYPFTLVKFMAITPFFKAVGEVMPRVLGIQSYTTSLLYLGLYLPLDFYKAGQALAAQTPLRGRKRFDPRDHEKEKRQLQYKCLAHASNIAGATAFLYFSNPWGLIAGYLLWTGHYIAKLEEKNLEESPSNKDRLWIVLYGFGAITCIACALFAHEAIPITAAIIAARVFATALSSVETGLFFYNLSLKTISVVKTGAAQASSFMTPKRPKRPQQA